MNKETGIIKLGRVVYPKSVNFSNWQVDEVIQIPVRPGRVPIPLWPSRRRECAAGRGGASRKRLGAMAAMVLGLLCLSASFSANASQSVSLAWSASTDSSTAGYIVYTGTSIANLTNSMNVGTNTTVTITGLKEGTTNYFAVSGYNSANIAGALSPAISYIVPGLMVMTSGGNTGTPPTLNFPVAAGHYYEVQATTNLTNPNSWTNIYQTATATNNSWTSFQDRMSIMLPERFYRLVMH
jgi:hypothetical protein